MSEQLKLLEPREVCVQYNPNGNKKHFCTATLTLRYTLPGDKGMESSVEKSFLTGALNRAFARLVSAEPSNTLIQMKMNSVLAESHMEVSNLALNLPQGE